VFLALKGWVVTGFDASDEGFATAQRNATRAGVKINAVRETEAAFDYGAGQWDLIVFTYEPFPITSAAYAAGHRAQAGRHHRRRKPCTGRCDP
jgi:hypothetical protein